MKNDKKTTATNKEKNNKTFWPLLRIVALAIILGLLAGGAGALIAFGYLSDYLSELVTPEPVTTISPTARVVTPGTVESAVESAKEKVVPALVVFYAKKDGETAGKSIYFDSDILGRGVVFTSDGWLITSMRIFDSLDKAGIRASVNGDLYELEEVLFDENTASAFVKIAGENLPVVQLADEQYIDSGDRMIFALGRDSFIATNLISKFYQPVTEGGYIEDSEALSSRLLLGPGGLLGAPIINYNGEVVGLSWPANDSLTVGLPHDALRPLMKGLLKENDLHRPYLGISYIDLARVEGIGLEISGGHDEGALVWSTDEENPAVEEGSPADGAGLQKGDIILSVNDETLNSHGSLAWIMLDYDPGDRLNLEVWRNGEIESVNLTLGTFTE
jgi:S1-C subfamily serine protease